MPVRRSTKGLGGREGRTRLWKGRRLPLQAEEAHLNHLVQARGKPRGLQVQDHHRLLQGKGVAPLPKPHPLLQEEPPVQKGPHHPLHGAAKPQGLPQGREGKGAPGLLSLRASRVAMR